MSFKPSQQILPFFERDMEKYIASIPLLDPTMPLNRLIGSVLAVFQMRRTLDKYQNQIQEADPELCKRMMAAYAHPELNLVIHMLFTGQPNTIRDFLCVYSLFMFHSKQEYEDFALRDADLEQVFQLLFSRSQL